MQSVFFSEQQLQLFSSRSHLFCETFADLWFLFCSRISFLLSFFCPNSPTNRMSGVMLKKKWNRPQVLYHETLTSSIPAGFFQAFRTPEIWDQTFWPSGGSEVLDPLNTDSNPFSGAFCSFSTFPDLDFSLVYLCVTVFKNNLPHVLPYSCSTQPQLHSRWRLPRLTRLLSESVM